MPCENTPFVLHGGHEGRAFLRRYDPDQVLRSGDDPLSARFELPWHAGEHSHLVFIALLVQVGALMAPLARPPIAQDSALRATQ